MLRLDGNPDRRNKMRIYWPCMVELPQCAYETLRTLHGNGVKVTCEKVVRWQDVDSLAEYLRESRTEGREGWVYTVHQMAQIEIAARTGLPFRVLDFFSPHSNEAVELAVVVQVDGKDRSILWLNEFFKRDGETRPVVEVASVH